PPLVHPPPNQRSPAPGCPRFNGESPPEGRPRAPRRVPAPTLYATRETSMLRALAVYLLLVTAAGACGAPDAASAPGGEAAVTSWLDHPDATGFRELSAGRTCTECIRLERVATLGDPDGPGALTETERVVRDGQGRFWVGPYQAGGV